MAEFKISRFRYTWEGNWITSTAYNRDDVVYYRGSSWVCIRQHTSTTFNEDITYIPPGETLATPAWVKMAEGRIFSGEWASNTLYEENTVVLHGGNLYLCAASHTSSTYFNSDINNWEVFAVGHNFRNTWTASARYLVGDVVRYNGYTYQCVLEHVAGSVNNGIAIGNNDAVDDSTAETWKILSENYHYTGTYTTNTRYRKNDLVKYGGSILKCITEHTSSGSLNGIVVDNFITYLPGFEYDSQWNSSTYYSIGDVVQWGGLLYLAVTFNQNSQPGASLPNFEQSNPAWQVIVRGTRFEGEYDPDSGRLYKNGDVVRKGGVLYKSLTEQFVDGSSLEIYDNSNWEVILPGYNFRGTWRNNEEYYEYDLVYFRGVTYYASTPHISTFESFPGDNGNGIDYWTIVTVGDQNAALTLLGDIVTYNLKRLNIFDGSTSAVIGDNSTLGTTNIPIGTQDQLLIVEDNQGSIGYETWGNLQRVFFVRTNGVDDDTDPDRGINYLKPYKTLKFALEKANDNYEGYTSIKLSTGEYREILPMIVPKRTAIIGEELRSVTILPNLPIPEIVNDFQHTIAALVRVGIIMGDIIQGIPLSAPQSNSLAQDTSFPGTGEFAGFASSKIGFIQDTINYRVNGTGSQPSITGSNTPSFSEGLNSSLNILDRNTEFIIDEVLAFLRNNFPNETFDSVILETTFRKFIAAIRYDLIYTGSYKSITEARWYSNAVLGSSAEDMFYVRDTTGIRNMTLRGLEGTLPPIAEGDTYSIPTGGAFVSLDPGWGPNDQTVWITNRSCYIQNVTTFGVGAIGQKVDGLLHNGGNRSIVSNDFTQVISDGIGAWMLNGGRGELVSVFTYYAHIGMFSLDGGIIRATNGNSSYGDFGAVADGIDPEETVRYGYLNTRNQQAQIASAFAGEVNDFILALEFTNCGQDYTTASYSITSSGVGARAIQEEFRDNALFTVEVFTRGEGLTQFGNQAQAGDAFTITLAANESALEENILGMRILLTSGVGTGQYGYVYSYNPGTKVLTVYRESDNQPGWDNLIPGTPSSTVLNTGTRYRIEPRPIISSPGFAVTEVTLTSSNSWAAAVYGETSATFTGLVGQLGSGEVVEDDGLVPIPAEFTVIKSGRTYTVAITNSGAGYAVGDTITIDGSELGGTSVEHDISLTVSATSDDSTNSIVSFIVDSTNIAASGNFVLTPQSGTAARYSADGETWTAFSMPIAGNWKCLAAGENKFVAIANGSSNAASSTTGIDWTLRAMPASRNWNGVAYGKLSTVTQGVFVAVAGNLNAAAYSTNSTTWVSSTMPTFGDSTLNEWVDITFGSDKFVAIANTGNIAAVGTWNGSTLSWQGALMDAVADSSQKDWVSVAYGNQRFVAISSTGDVAYSFDGLDWLPATMPTQDGSTRHKWIQLRYGQGVFFAVGETGARIVGDDLTQGPSTYCATSYDGIVWTEQTLSVAEIWGVVAFGSPDVTLGDSTVSNNKPTWVVAPSFASTKINRVYTGARALCRVVLRSTDVGSIRIWEPGSGYSSPPVLENIICPTKTAEPNLNFRIGDRVLAQPLFVNKGSNYKTSSTIVTVSGDGYADVTPVTKFITVGGLSVLPGPGAQFYIGGSSNFFRVTVIGTNQDIDNEGLISATFQISPTPDYDDYLENGDEILIRERYSQVRITGHDFLDIGTGNFEETNYPVLYSDYEYTNEPANEVFNLNGGQVFYTSTDQDGNFRAGEQFAVEQATGIVTINADFFDLQGLTELRLAGILVGSTAVIREFSKETTFSQNSNNIISTQRAIRAYLSSRLNIGGEDLLTPGVTAGSVVVGPNKFDTTYLVAIDVPVIADFSGEGAGVSGSMLAQTMFFRSFIND
jgi:hypothetical protein